MTANFILCFINFLFVFHISANPLILSREEGCNGGNRHLVKRYAPIPRVLKGNFDVPVSNSVNQRRSYIYYFDYMYLPHQNWTVKVCVRSSKVTAQYPLLIAVRQSMSIRSLRLPFTFYGTDFNYSYVCYPLCPLGNIYPYITVGVQTVEVELSSRSPYFLPFELLVSNVTQYVIETNQPLLVNITPLEPSILEYYMPDGVEAVVIEAFSRSRMCMALAIQDVQCPFYYSDRKIEHKGYYETATDQAGITAERSLFKHGKMYIIIMLRPSDKECTGSFDTNHTEPRRKEVTLIILPQITGSSMGFIVLYTILIYISFSLLTVVIFEAERFYSISRSASGTEEENLLPINGDGESVAESEASSGNENEEVEERVALIVPQKFAEEEEERSKEKERFHLEMQAYPSYLVIICVFYGLPVLQLVLLNQKIVRLTGDQDVCYYNFLCSRTWGIFNDFNHVFSNIGYFILGCLFLWITWRKRSFDGVDDQRNLENNARTGTRWITATFATEDDKPVEDEDERYLRSQMFDLLNYAVESKKSTSDQAHVNLFFIRGCDAGKVMKLSLERFRFVSASPVLPITATFARKDKKKLGTEDERNLSNALSNSLGYEANVRSDADQKLIHLSYIRSQDLGTVRLFGNRDETFELKSSNLSEPPGLPRITGMFYALGVALIMEAFCSAFYHICPNKTNFQFDTTFMYIISVLGVSKLYYGRHPESVPRSSVLLWPLMATAALLVILSFIAEYETPFWVIYTIFHGWVIIYIAHRLFFLSAWRCSWNVVCDFCLRFVEKTVAYSSKIRDHPGRAVVTWLVITGNIVWDIFHPYSMSFVLFQLTLFIGNFLIYVLFYAVMKICYKEKIHWKKVGVLCVFCFFWFPALYYFFDVKTEWQKTPAISREANGYCMVGDFYDEHDMWHFLSSFALFFSFLLILYLDEGIKNIPFEQIKKI